MKRSRKVLRGHFLARLKRQREKYEAIINRGDRENTDLRESLENMCNQNLSLDIENDLLRERIAKLKKKKWYQFVVFNYNPNESQKEKSNS